MSWAITKHDPLFAGIQTYTLKYFACTFNRYIRTIYAGPPSWIKGLAPDQPCGSTAFQFNP